MPEVVQVAEWFRERHTDGSVSIVWKKLIIYLFS